MDPVTVAKAAVAAVKNKDSVGKLIAAILAAVLIPVLILTFCIMQLVSAFMPDGAVKTSDSFEVCETSVYSSVQIVMKSYYGLLKEQMEHEKRQIEDEHTEKEIIENESGETITVERCTASVSIEMNYIGAGTVIAYLVSKDCIDISTADINEGEVEKFLNTAVRINIMSENENTYTVCSEFLSDEEIAEIYFSTEAEKKEFLLLCDVYGEYFNAGVVQFMMEDGAINFGETVEESILTVPLYLQYQEPWGSISYGNGTIAKNGCCPVCIAMVFSYLKGQSIYPNDITAWSGNTYYVNGQGTSWNIFSEAAGHWNINCTNIGKDQNVMISALSSGKPVIASMGPGTFTKGGHFIVLTGITEDGKIKVNDPNDNNTKKHSEKEYLISLILRESKNMWVFE